MSNNSSPSSSPNPSILTIHASSDESPCCDSNYSPNPTLNYSSDFAFQQKLDKKIEELIEQQTSLRSQFEKITEKQIQDLLALQESQQKSLQNQYEKRMEKHIQEILSVQEAQYSILQNQFEKKIAKQIQDLLDLQESQQASKMN